MQQKFYKILFFFIIISSLSPAQIQLDWASYFDKPGHSQDYAQFITNDAFGHIYAAGISGQQIVVVKLNSSGNKIWQYRYTGGYASSPWLSYPSGVEIDAAGNVYVSGSVNYQQGGNDYDYITLKISKSGSLSWVKTYDDSLGLDDFETALKCDPAGNVYVTGYASTNNQTAYTTIKYDSAGNQLWTAVFDTIGSDKAVDMEIDAAGNVYVTGTSEKNYLDIVTIKYDNNGQEIWRRRFDGIFSLEDVPVKIKLDASSNVYIAGTVNNFGYDVLLMKYNSSGLYQWGYTYNSINGYNDEGIDLQIDNQQNAIIAGNSKIAFGASCDLLLLKFNPAGLLVLDTAIDGGNNYAEYLSSISIDANNDIFMSATSHPNNFNYNVWTLKYSSGGSLLWQQSYTNSKSHGNAISLNSNGDVFVCGDEGTFVYGDTNFVVLNYSNSGASGWTYNLLNAPTSNFEAVDIAVSKDNYTYVVGYSDPGYIVTSPPYDDDIILIKYDLNGDTLWVREFDSSPTNPNHIPDMGTSVVTDDSGYVYVSGTGGDTLLFNGQGQSVLLKYDSLGNLLWHTFYKPDTITNWYVPGGVKALTDSEGNVYLTSIFFPTTSGGYSTCHFVKYDSNGNLKWEKLIAGQPISGYVSGLPVIKIKSSNEIYVTINATTIPLCSPNCGSLELYRLDSLGNFVWQRNFYDPDLSGITVYPVDLELDCQSNIYIGATTTCTSPTGCSVMVAIKYDSNGTFQWSNFMYDSIFGYGAYILGRAMVIDKQNNVYLAGLAVGYGSNCLYYLRKINSSGVIEWADTLLMDWLYLPWQTDYDLIELKIDKYGHLILGGTIPNNDNTNKNYFVAIWDVNGNKLQTTCFDGIANNHNILTDMELDNDGNLLLTGSSMEFLDYFSFCTAKFSFDSAYQTGFNFSQSQQTVSFFDTLVVGNSFFWDFGDGFTSTLQNPQHTYASPGIYTVCLTVSYICSSDSFCADINVLPIGINEIDPYSHLTIFPNPTSGKFTIQSPTEKISQITVTNLSGQTIFKKDFQNNFNSPIEIDLTNHSKGIYLIQVITGEEVYNQKIILN